MSKLLAVLISFTVMFSGMMVHAASPVHSSKEADFGQSYAISGCHAGERVSRVDLKEDVNDKKKMPSESHHCVLDFVIVTPPAFNYEGSRVLREIAFLQRQLSPTFPERLGKPPKA